MKYRILPLLLCVVLVFAWLPGAMAADTDAPEQTAPDSSAQQPQQEATLLSTKRSITHSEGFPDISVIYDDVLTKAVSTKETASLTLENDQGIGSMYFIYHYPYAAGYTVTDNTTGKTAVTGYSYTPIFTVAQEGEPLRVVRIREAMAAYEAGYIDKVTKETYDAMAYALERIEARVAGN